MTEIRHIDLVGPGARLAMKAATRAEAAAGVVAPIAADLALPASKLLTIAADLQGANTIGTVAANMAKIAALSPAGVVASMTALSAPSVLTSMAALSSAGVVSNMAALAPRAADIGTLAPIAGKIATAADNAAAIVTAADNIAPIVLAPAAAITAQAWAESPTAPSGAGTKSAKTLAGEAGEFRDQAATSLASIKGAGVLTSRTSEATAVLRDGVLVVTEKRTLSTDNYGAGLPISNFVPNAFFATWSATHRGLPSLIAGEESAVHGLELPAGYMAGENAWLAVGIKTPVGSLRLSGGVQNFVAETKPRVLFKLNLAAYANQSLPRIIWYGSPVEYSEGDLLVIFGANFNPMHVGAIGPNDGGPAVDPAVAGSVFMVEPLLAGATAEDAFAALTSTNADGGTVNSTVRVFPYKAKIAAGGVRAGLGGANSYAVIGADGKLDPAIVGDLTGLDNRVTTLAAQVVETQQAVGQISGGDAALAAKGDAKVSTLITGYNAAAKTITITDAAFTSADIGKIIYVTSTGGSNYTPQLSACNIVSVQSATTATVDGSFTGNFVPSGQILEAVWGTDETAKLKAMGALAVKTGQFRIPPGQFILRECLMDLTGYTNGFSVVGAGRDVSVFRVDPGYNFATTRQNVGSCLLWKGEPANNDNGGLFSGFSIIGPRCGLTRTPGYYGVVNGWLEAYWQDMRLLQLGGLSAGLRLNAKATLNHVYSKGHFYGGTIGIQAVNVIQGYNVHVGNCSGVGMHVANVSGVDTTAQEPMCFTDSLFDECDQAALLIQNSGDVRLTGCTAFGGPNSTTFGLELIGNSVATLIGSVVSGYGPGTPRKGARVEEGSILRATAGSRVLPSGDGRGVALDNNGLVIVDGSSVVTGSVVGSGVLRRHLPGTPLPAALSANPTNAEIATAVNAVRSLLISTTMAS